MSALEHVPPGEAERIQNIVDLTTQMLERRYPQGKEALRGQHAKGHACVSGTLRVAADLAPDRRRGVFARPGHEYQVWVRFSNASSADDADSAVPKPGGPAVHGSRGMALKILGVAGTPLTSMGDRGDQDFLMVNHPVFAFANVEDYEAITKVLAADGDDKPDAFFARIRRLPDGKPDLADAATRRALGTLGIVQRIKSPSTDADPAAFQTPPACPVDNRYFGGAPFLFGDGQVMRVRAVPVEPPPDGAPDATSRDYLRTALRQRLSPGAAPVRFEFQAQIRSAADLAGSIDRDIEDACADWNETSHRFETLGVITIPAQDFDAAERRAQCEALVFSPWQGIADHRPLGGINRLRRAVYEASAAYRRK